MKLCQGYQDLNVVIIQAFESCRVLKLEEAHKQALEMKTLMLEEADKVPSPIRILSSCATFSFSLLVSECYNVIAAHMIVTLHNASCMLLVQLVFPLKGPA
jgi:hypothetical protein